MYKYEDYKDNIDLDQLLKMFTHAKRCFADNWVTGIISLDDLLWVSGCDSWVKIACVDKLVELGYITVVEKKEFSNHTTYRNIRL